MHAITKFNGHMRMIILGLHAKFNAIIVSAIVSSPDHFLVENWEWPRDEGTYSVQLLPNKGHVFIHFFRRKICCFSQ